MLVTVTKLYFGFLVNHYSGATFFIPKPGANEGDDGFLLANVMNGCTGYSYLFLLDGKSLETIAKANLPEYISTSIHATWVNEML